MASWWERHGVPRLIKCACSQGQIMKARSKVVPRAAGDVLELGCGGGINMEFYDPARVTRFTGLDPSPELLAMSRAAAAARGMIADIQGGVGETSSMKRPVPVTPMSKAAVRAKPPFHGRTRAPTVRLLGAF